MYSTEQLRLAIGDDAWNAIPDTPNPPTSFRPAAARQKPQRSPDKQASIARRRRLARASPVPPELVDKFTTCEHAVITIVVDQIRRHGVCSLCKDAIAALAGTCRTMVRNAMSKAREAGLLYREERRRRGQKSLTNLVRILRPEWRRWVQWVGGNLKRTTKDTDFRSAPSGFVESSAKRSAGVGFANSMPSSLP